MRLKRRRKEFRKFNDITRRDEDIVKGLKLLKAFIKEEIGRNYHTVDPTPNTWENFQDYEIECFPTETGAYTVDVSFQGKKLSPTARFSNETEAKHFARMIVDKHRVNAMNTK